MEAEIISNHPQKALLQVTVADSGIGIAEENMSKLFLPFNQADTSTSRKFGGTGLGLAISRRLAELLGGDLTAVSTLGKGSRFTVTIHAGDLRKAPKSAELVLPSSLLSSSNSTQDESSSKSKSSKIDGHRILLVEDGPDNQRLITFLLKKLEP